jgi:hypothetical protein
MGDVDPKSVEMRVSGFGLIIRRCFGGIFEGIDPGKRRLFLQSASGVKKGRRSDPSNDRLWLT